MLTSYHYAESSDTSGIMSSCVLDGVASMCCSTGQDALDCCNSGQGFPWGNNTALALNATANPSLSSSSPTSTYTTSSYQLPTTSQSVATASSSICPAPSSSIPIGVGVGLGVPLIVALATIAWLVVMLSKARKAQNVASNDYNHPPQWQPQYAAVPLEMQEHGKREPLAELHHDSVPQEAPTSFK